MTSEKKCESNRANARKSTGPKTMFGKRNSSLNALLLGTHATKRIIPGEDLFRHMAIHDQILQSYRPAGPVELALCDQILSLVWRLERLNAAEAVALKRASVSVVSNDVRATFDGPPVSDDAIDFTLNQSLVRELCENPEDYRPPEPPNEAEMKQWRKGPVVLKSRQPPVEMTYFKSFTSKAGDSPCLEIQSQIRSATKDLLSLHTALEELQERRRSVTPPANDASLRETPS